MSEYKTYQSRYDESVVYEARLVHAAELNEAAYEIRLPGTDEILALVPSNTFESIYEIKGDS